MILDNCHPNNYLDHYPAKQAHKLDDEIAFWECVTHCVSLYNVRPLVQSIGPDVQDVVYTATCLDLIDMALGDKDTICQIYILFKWLDF